jgi:diadenosine tetraphosphate (Ap4A) HIT family hydrolase
MGCELCEGDGGRVLWRDDFCRVVRAAVEGYPGFCRVILNRHVSEMSDLAAPERERLMRVVFACEQAVRELLRPDKVNLASLGNQVPHLHWHVIARYGNDRHFPDAVWAAPRRAGGPPRAQAGDADIAARLAELLGIPATG